MTDLIPLPYKIGILLCCAAVIAFGAYFKGYNNANAKYIAVKVQLDSERAQAKLDAEQAKKHADGVTADVALAWSRALEHLRANPRIRVLPTTNCHLPDSHARTSSEVDGTGLKLPADSRTITSEECEVIANNAIFDATQLTWLQHWINEQR